MYKNFLYFFNFIKWNSLNYSNFNFLNLLVAAKRKSVNAKVRINRSCCCDFKRLFLKWWYKFGKIKVRHEEVNDQPIAGQWENLQEQDGNVQAQLVVGIEIHFCSVKKSKKKFILNFFITLVKKWVKRIFYWNLWKNNGLNINTLR